VSECFNCGQDDHFYQDCPNRGPAAERPQYRAADLDEHMARIDAAVAAWFRRDITITQKRQVIAAENLLWYGGPVTRNGVHLTRE
jgi:hypothetical protein